MPELNTSMPLTPLTPELADRMLTMPLDVAVPSPDARLTAPPVLTVLRPAWASTEPPAPDVPLPTDDQHGATGTAGRCAGSERDGAGVAGTMSCRS